MSTKSKQPGSSLNFWVAEIFLVRVVSWAIYQCGVSLIISFVLYGIFVQINQRSELPESILKFVFVDYVF